MTFHSPIVNNGAHDQARDAAAPVAALASTSADGDCTHCGSAPGDAGNGLLGQHETMFADGTMKEMEIAPPSSASGRSATIGDSEWIPCRMIMSGWHHGVLNGIIEGDRNNIEVVVAGFDEPASKSRWNASAAQARWTEEQVVLDSDLGVDSGYRTGGGGNALSIAWPVVGCVSRYDGEAVCEVGSMRWLRCNLRDCHD